MGRLIALLLGGFGLGAYIRRRRRHAPEQPEYSPADELKAKLAETRAQAEEPEPEPEAPRLDDRRAEVHERARRAIDDLS